METAHLWRRRSKGTRMAQVRRNRHCEGAHSLRSVQAPQPKQSQALRLLRPRLGCCLAMTVLLRTFVSSPLFASEPVISRVSLAQKVTDLAKRAQATIE